MTDTPFDMPKPPASFEERGGWVVRRLMADLSLTAEQASGIVGNLGYESAGFTKLHEIGQPEGRGGYGWGQWTADRRRTFQAWAMKNHLPWASDEANYGYLLEELRTSQKETVAAVRKVTTVDDAVFSVGQTFERPGGTTPDFLPGFDGRLHWANRALSGAGGAPPLAPTPPADDPIRRAVVDLQAVLKASGYYAGAVDGDPGSQTVRALANYRSGSTA